MQVGCSDLAQTMAEWDQISRYVSVNSANASAFIHVNVELKVRGEVLTYMKFPRSVAKT